MFVIRQYDFPLSVALRWQPGVVDKIAHADIALACVLRFTREAHPKLFDASRYAALASHADACEALPPFKEIVQPLAPPSGN